MIVETGADIYADFCMKALRKNINVPTDIPVVANLEEADRFFRAVREGLPAPISLREGLAMTIPGIYAEQSLKQGGEILTIYYPWDKQWTSEIK